MIRYEQGLAGRLDRIAKPIPDTTTRSAAVRGAGWTPMRAIGRPMTTAATPNHGASRLPRPKEKGEGGRPTDDPAQTDGADEGGGPGLAQMPSSSMASSTRRISRPP